MEGGINAWNGLVATGAPDAGFAYFSDKVKPDEIIALAWSLEEGARRFYSGIQEKMKDESSKELFSTLSADEVRHKDILAKLNAKMSGTAFTPAVLGEIMEGGMRISDALSWADGKGIEDILDYSIAMETNSYDLYLKMECKIEGENLKIIFRALADEEKKHLARLTALLDERL